MAAKFDYAEPIQFAWDKVKSNLGFFIGALLAGGALSTVVLVAMIATTAGSTNNTISPLFFVLFALLLIFTLVVQIGLFRASLKVTDGEKVGLGDLVPSVSVLFKFLVSSMVYALIVSVGSLLLVIPGMIWAIQFQFFGFFVIDGAGPIEALKKSSQMTKGAKVDLFVFGLLLYVLNLVGELALLVGLFITVPMTLIALARVYRNLSANTDPEATAEVETGATPVAS
ncbi:MAG: DUF975 family protein [Candidatus Aquicultor sp.]